MKTRSVLLIIITLLLPALCLAAPKKNTSVSAERAIKPVKNQDGRRIALVIGNGDYKHTGRLANPVNDARLMAETLKEVGFTLHGGKALLNLTRDQMIAAVEEFGERLGGDDTALVFYAGHGMQVRGENYLVPVDADIKKEWEVDTKTVDGRRIFSKLAGRNNAINIVVLDACRNNPFARSFRSSTSGLAPVSAPSGTIVAFSTAPGQVAEDGSGQNSVYTRELARSIKQPGLRIEDVFMQVRQTVEQATANNQQPWENTALKGRFYFVDQATSADNAAERRIREAEERARQAEERARQIEQQAAELSRTQVAMAPRPQAPPAENPLLYKDPQTGLIWPRNGNIAGKTMNWHEAMAWVKTLNHGGYSDWRLPTKDELEAFAKRGGETPLKWFNANGFSNVESGYSGYYWSSSTYAGGTTYAWIVVVNFGFVGFNPKGNYYYVWPVRAGQ